MNVIRHLLVALGLSVGLAAPASFAQLNVSVSIGINVPAYPQLVPVAGYPVYYAPALNANYFFYDGLYWVYVDDNWYHSVWYNGPWTLVAPEFVPVYILRVPVRYYRRPPPYFHAWALQAPPRWGERFGPAWEQHHRGWDHWNRAAVPRPAPLPTYQRKHAGDHYPATLQQQETLHRQHYRYQPKEPVTRQQYQQMSAQAKPPPHANAGQHAEGKPEGKQKGKDKDQGKGKDKDRDEREK